MNICSKEARTELRIQRLEYQLLQKLEYLEKEATKCECNKNYKKLLLLFRTLLDLKLSIKKT